MAKGHYVKDIKDGQVIAGLFVVQNCWTKKTKRGQNFWSLQLGDATGEIAAKVWNSDRFGFEPLPSGHVVEILQGKCESYQEKLQIIIEKLRVLTEEQVKSLPTNYFQADSGLNAQELWGTLDKILLDEFSCTPWFKFVTSVFNDAAIKEAFCTCPGAIRIHHAYKSGLLVHTLAVIRNCQSIANIYPWLDRPTLIVGALFHDIGKIREYGYALDFQHTVEGQLLGHMVLGVMLLEPFLAKANLTTELTLHLRHLILSHHGRLEFGACEIPKTSEALALHFADDLDSKMEIAKQAQAKVNPNSWTEPIFALDQRKLYAFQGSLPHKKSLQEPNQACQKASSSHEAATSINAPTTNAQSNASLEQSQLPDDAVPPWNEQELDAKVDFFEYGSESAISAGDFDVNPPVDIYEDMASGQEDLPQDFSQDLPQELQGSEFVGIDLGSAKPSESDGRGSKDKSKKQVQGDLF